MLNRHLALTKHQLITVSPSTLTSNPNEASTHVANMLQLRNLVRSIPTLYHSLDGSQSFLLKTIQNLLRDERLSKIEDLLARSLNEEAGIAKVRITDWSAEDFSLFFLSFPFHQESSGIAAINNKVYAVRANFSRMLDVARATYKENVGDIHDLQRSITEEHNLPFALTYQKRGGGFWFSLSKNDLEDAELPRGFINISTKGNKWMFTSLELVSE